MSPATFRVRICGWQRALNANPIGRSKEAKLGAAPIDRRGTFRTFLAGSKSVPTDWKALSINITCRICACMKAGCCTGYMYVAILNYSTV